jgi:multidrug resistance protein, MATE family
VHLKVGFEGAAISMSVTRNLVPFGLVIYSWLFTTGECWRKIDGKAFQNWMSMIKLAVPACVMVEVECIGFEVLTLLAGINGTAELCAQTLLVTLCGFIFKVPYSLGIAASTQIAELLGNGSADIAREVSKLALLLAGVIGSLIVVVLLYFRKELPYLFTNEEEVVALMLGAVPLLAVFTLIDAVAGVITGVIRGMGKQYIGALIQTLGYYVIGLPCSIFAAFSLGWHLSGLWAGISIAMLLICVLQGLYIYLLDWNSLVEEAKIRNALDWDT